VDTRADLLRQITDKAVVHGKVVLSSGREADWYVDLRRITLDADAAPLVGQVMLEATADLDFDAVGGLTMGADPVAAAMLHAAAARGRKLDAFVVRKAAKDYGTANRLEGVFEAGSRVCVVEDVVTSGGALLDAVAALREAELDVCAAICVVDREEGGAAAIAAAGVPFHPLFTASDLGVTSVTQSV